MKKGLLTFDSAKGKFLYVGSCLSLREKSKFSNRSDENDCFNSIISPCPSRVTNIRNKWDDDQRVLVVVLRRFYDMNWDEITRIFNHCHGNHLRECGFARGIPKNRIISQYMDWSSHRVRKAVFETPFKNVWFSVDKHIHKAAQELQIRLTRRTNDVTKCDFDNKLCGGRGSRKLSASQRKTLKRRPLLNPGMLWLGDKKISPFRLQPRTHLDVMKVPERPVSSLDRSVSTRPISLASAALPNQVAAPKSPTIPTPFNDNPITYEVPRSPIPPLLYRTYCIKSAGINRPTVFVAGLFTQLIGDIPQPIPASHSLFQTMLENHVNKRRVLGPFISITDSLLWAVFIASKSPEDAHVAVIETKHLCNIYPISDYMQGIPLEFSHRKYKGTCEYLVWGKIPGSAIRGDFSFSSLNTIARTTLSLSAFNGGHSVYKLSAIIAATNSALSEKIGATIGRILRLMGLNQYTECELLSRAVESIVQGWSFRGPLDKHIIEVFYQKLVNTEEKTDSLASAFGRKNSIKSFQDGVHRGLLDLDGQKARMLRFNKRDVSRG